MIAVKTNKGSFKSISITNQHASAAAVVSLFLDDGRDSGAVADSHIFLAGPISIPSGVTLFLDNVNFDNDIYALKITNSGSGLPISIIAR